MVTRSGNLGVYLRQLPYRKLEKVFTADEADRPVLMSAYMDEWYGASKENLIMIAIRVVFPRLLVARSSSYDGHFANR